MELVKEEETFGSRETYYFGIKGNLLEATLDSKELESFRKLESYLNWCKIQIRRVLKTNQTLTLGPCNQTVCVNLEKKEYVP